MGEPQESYASLLEAVGDLAGAGSAGVFGQIFEFMELAEEEIAAAPPEANQVFRWILPHEVLLQSTLDRRLWRHHTCELIERYLACRTMPHGRLREQMAPATSAELLLMLNTVSLAQPLRHELAEATSHLFREVFPNAELLEEEHYPFPQEPSPYMVDRILELKREHKVRARAELKNKEVPYGTDHEAPLQAALDLG